jgi:hypothetical protein
MNWILSLPGSGGWPPRRRDSLAMIGRSSEALHLRLPQPGAFEWLAEIETFRLEHEQFSL